MSSLFEKISIGKNLTLKNRISMAAIYCGHAGHDKEYRDFYLERAKGGAGMLIIPQSMGDPLDSWKDPNFYNGFKELVERAHSYDCKVILQLYETIDDINQVSEEFLDNLPKRYADAAETISKTGFDGLELHGAHYMPFMSLYSPTQNRRKDSYGGSFKNRTRVIIDTVKEIKKRASNLPLFYRLSATDFIDGGVDLESSIIFSKELEKAGVDCLDISAGTGESEERIFPKANSKPGCYIYLAEAIKKEVNIPVITVGRINSRELAHSIVTEGKADIVSIGRGLIADPELPKKLEDNRESEVIRCLHCNKGCLTDSLMVGKPINCYINPW